MSRKHNYSDEYLNQYLDGELDPKAEKEIMADTIKNPALNRHIRELRQVQALIRQAFPTDVSSRPTTRNGNRRLAGFSIAASMLVALGTLIGWTLQAPEPIREARTVIGPDQIRTVPQLVSHRHSEAVKAILHVSTSEPGSMQVALDEAEYLLGTYRDNGRKLRLEILVNAGGLEHYRRDRTTFEARLLSLHKNYPNLSLLACNKTIQRLKREKHEDAKLLPGVEVVPSALDRILQRLGNGWSYIKA